MFVFSDVFCMCVSEMWSEMWAKLFIPALLSFLLDTASTNVLFFPRASLYATYDFWRINLPIETRTTWKLASKLEYRIRNFKSSFTTTYFNYHHYRQTIVISAISVTSLLLCGFAACIGCKCVSRISGLSLCPAVLLRRYIPDSNPTPGCTVSRQDVDSAATSPDPTDTTDPVDTRCPLSTRAQDTTRPTNCATQ